MNTTVFAAPKGISAPAPGWVTYITIAISSISMLVALFTFLRGGVRIKLKVVYAYRSVISTNPDGDEKANAQSVVRLQVTNRRRGEIDISDFILIPPRASDAPKVLLGPRSIVDGPTLRYRMPGLSTEYWEINTSAAFRAFERIAYKDKEYKWYGESDPANKFRFAVLLGDGKLVRSNKVPLSKFKSLGVNETIQPGKQKFISAYPRSDLTHNEQAHAKRAVTL